MKSIQQHLLDCEKSVPFGFVGQKWKTCRLDWLRRYIYAGYTADASPVEGNEARSYRKRDRLG